MESFNIYKGYDTLNHNDLQLHDHKASLNDSPRRPIVIIAISSIVLLTLLVGSLIGALIYETSTELPEQLDLAESIRAVCSATQYPDSCFASISSINSHPKSDPLFICSLSLRAAIDAVSKLTSLPKILISKINDPPILAALRDCESLFTDALDRLNRSAATVAKGVRSGEKLLKGPESSDVKTWISAAMTDQETCVDGLKEMGGSTVLDHQVVAAVNESRVCTSNSLAILVNMKTILEKFE
ncbi:hypothetical protein Nepgr_018691 [Nepenthes gracilis]|uniref:pectinesterase n=1 Tax=Nepenthes gracilis TaxID=150966 RepID=A0AAD3SRX8_NEPGR|nr:hypothetical protein Nepgr_018691 [Nepenthes gracilis]